MDNKLNLGEDYIRPEKLSKRWKKPEKTLRNWRSSGKGPEYIKIGGTVWYSMKSIVELESKLKP